MSTDDRKAIAEQLGMHSASRRHAIGILGLTLMMPLTACGQGGKNMQSETVLALIMYSYVNRPIHDIIFDGTDIGVANSYGGTGVITAVRIPFGPQTLTWTLGGPEGMARNGEKKKMKNKLTLSSAQIPPDTRYIGVHLYPDDTVELTFDEFIPERTARGLAILSAAK